MSKECDEDGSGDSSDSLCATEWMYATDENAATKFSDRSENALKYTEPRLVRRIYLLGRLISKIFEEENMFYWITGGTALGAVRHKGLIPWDDDLDICVEDKDIPQLLNMKSRLALDNLVLCEAPSFGGYRIFHSKESERIRDANGSEGLNYGYPFCDIFVMTKSKDKYVSGNRIPNILWPNEWFYAQNVQSWERTLFGDFYFNCTGNIEEYLNRYYGDDWGTVGCTQDYIHVTREYVKPVKFEMSGKTFFEPAKPFR